MGLTSRCQQGCAPSKDSRGESRSLFIWVVGRIQFLEVVGLRFPFLCLLSAEDPSWLLEDAAFLVW